MANIKFSNGVLQDFDPMSKPGKSGWYEETYYTTVMNPVTNAKTLVPVRIWVAPTSDAQSKMSQASALLEQYIEKAPSGSEIIPGTGITSGRNVGGGRNYSILTGSSDYKQALSEANSNPGAPLTMDLAKGQLPVGKEEITAKQEAVKFQEEAASKSPIQAGKDKIQAERDRQLAIDPIQAGKDKIAAARTSSAVQQQLTQAATGVGYVQKLPSVTTAGTGGMTVEQGKDKIQTRRDELNQVQQTAPEDLTFEQKILAERIRQNKILQGDPATLSPEDRITRERITQEQNRIGQQATQQPTTVDTTTPTSLDYTPTARPETQISGNVQGAQSSAVRQKLIQGMQAPSVEAPAAISTTPDQTLMQRAGTIAGTQQGQVASTMPEVSQAINVEQERQKALTDYLSRPPTETATARLERLNREQKRPELIKTREQTLQALTNINNLLMNVKRGVELRGRDVGITAAQGQRLGTQEAEPLTVQSQALNNTLNLVNQSIQDVDTSVAQFMKAGQEDQANELQRLTQLASQPGMTPTQQADIARKIEEQTTLAKEQRVFTQNIAKDLLDFDQALSTEELKGKYELAIQNAKSATEVQKLQIQQKKEITDRFNSGLETLKKFALENGAELTGNFTAGVRSAEERMDAGESPESVLADLAAAVSSNKNVQAKMAAELKRAQQLAKGGTGTGSASSSAAPAVTSWANRILNNPDNFSISDVPTKDRDAVMIEIENQLNAQAALPVMLEQRDIDALNALSDSERAVEIDKLKKAGIDVSNIPNKSSVQKTDWRSYLPWTTPSMFPQ